MLKHSYWLWDSVLSKDFCNLVIKETDWTKKQKGTVFNSGNCKVDEKTRITDVVWENPMLPIGCVALAYINSANAQAGWNYDITSIEDIQIGRYEESGHYDWHADSSMPDVNNIQRKLSISIQLNDPSEYEGGKFEFKELPEKEQPKLLQGSVLVFPSFLQHKVTPITSGIRYSAVTWVNGPAFR
jgi:PKHD-type hydroxylase